MCKRVNGFPKQRRNVPPVRSLRVFHAPGRKAEAMSVEVSPNNRRPDLDALRSLAMLLGIGLHAAMAYIGAAWMINDEPPAPLLGLFVAGVHGFRMPLFFLLSGFFTVMLWQRRGLGGLVSQRSKRILLPLAIGCLTILPAMWLATNWALAEQSAKASKGGAAATDIWTAAAAGDLEAVRRYATGSDQLNAQDATMGVTPLGWTALTGKPEATGLLLELGADPNARYRDGNTPMHTACFFGRAEVAERLIKAGTDLTITSQAGERPVNSLRHDRQTTEYIAGFVKIPLDFKEVVAGRERIRALIDAGAAPKEAAGTTPDLQGESANGWFARMQAGTFFQHLWFLWFLCWLNAGFAVVAYLSRFAPSVRLPAPLFSMPLCLLWLVPLAMVPQHFMHLRGAIPGFGPDTSTGLLPMPHVLLYYSVFFAFGALAFCAHGQDAKFGRFWWLSLLLAFLILPIALMFAYNPVQASTIIESEAARKLASNLMQVLFAWLATFGMLGLCESIFAKPRLWVRYLSDSAYWLYLAHLPLVIVGQVLLTRVEMPTPAKFAVLLVGSVAILLVSYHFVVRRTFIGAILNGRRPG